MKRMSAIAHFRQLCCLGLGGQAVMPSLLSAVHELIPSESNAFFWADEQGSLAGFLPEYVIPEVVDSVTENFEGLLDRTLPIDFAGTMRSGRPVGNLSPVFNQAFYRSDLYHLVYRPYNLHHALDGVVRDTPNGKGLGAFVLARSASQPEFSPAEKDTLRRLTPYLAHALHAPGATGDKDFADSGDAGLMILDQAGHIAYISTRGREILYFATHSGLLPPPEPAGASVTLPPGLSSLHQSLIRIFQDRAAPRRCCSIKTHGEGLSFAPIGWSRERAPRAP